MRISVMGMGPVGLTTAACLADRRNRVIGVDINESRIKALRRGETPFYEPRLEPIVKQASKAGLLAFTTDYAEAVPETELSFVCVSTPPLRNTSANLTYVKNSLETIGRYLRKNDVYHIVAIKSTVPPETTSGLARRTLENSSARIVGKHFGLCSNPEFLREGSAVEDTFNPDRVVIGEIDRKSGDKLEKLWTDFYQNPRPPIIRTTPVNAELIKYASNSFLAMKISFINMFANLCQRIEGADVEQVAKGIGLDKRIGSHFLRAGVGFGGSCFGRDMKTLLRWSGRSGVKLPLVEATLAINENQPFKVIDLAKEHLKQIRGKKVALLGLSFKPKTDDIRDAVSLKIIDRLLQEGAKVSVYDPMANGNARKIFGGKIRYAASPSECIANAHCCIVVTEWDEFGKLKPEDFIRSMQNPLVIDGRRVYDWRKFQGEATFRAIGLSPPARQC